MQGTVDTVLDAIGDRFSDCELLIFDDGSRDGTGPLADTIAAADGLQRIKVVHNGVNKGFGYNFRRGVELAAKDYVAMIPGDNEIAAESVADIFAAVGKSDIVAPYTINTHVRPMKRRVISRGFTTAMNMLFGMRLRYFNGPAVYRSEVIRSIPITTSGFAFASSIMVRLIRSGHSYTEVGMYVRPQKNRRTKAFALRNVVGVVKTVLKLFWQVRVAERGKYSRKQTAT